MSTTKGKDPMIEIAREIMHLEQAHSATMEYLRNHYQEMPFEKVLFFAKQILNLEIMKDEWYHHITTSPVKDDANGTE